MAEEAQPGSTGKTKLKTVIMVGVILAVEAVVIVGAMMLVGGPMEVQATDALDAIEPDEGEKINEVLVLDAKLPNSKSGITYLYDTEIYVQVRQKHAERIAGELDQFQNEIKADVAAIWRMSDPVHFGEAKLETLTRKVEALLGQRFGADTESGDPIVTKCVIIMETGFRMDG